MKFISSLLRGGLTAAAISCVGLTGLSHAGSESWTPVTGGSTPGYGGVVRSSAVTPDGKLWVMTDGGGLHKSADGGANWTASNNGLGDLKVKSGFVGNTGTSTSPNMDSTTYTVFAGTSGGVFRSLDSGASFTALNAGLNCTYVNALTGLGTRLLAGTDCQTSSGVYYSDAGAAWTLATGLPPDTRVNSITRINPTVPTGATAIDYLLANTDSGIYKSTDSGAAWTALTSSPSGLNGPNVYNVGFSYLATASTPLLLIATVEGSGIFTSANEGATWVASNSGLPDNPRPLGGSSGELKTPNIRWVSVDGHGVYQSTDRAATWTLFAGQAVLPSARSVFRTGAAPNFVYYAATLAGPFKSTDNGQTWQKGGPGLAGGMTSNTAFDSTGKWYAGAADGVYQLVNNLWSKLPSLSSMASGHVLVRGDAVYATTSSAGVFKFDGTTWQALNTGLPANLVYRNPSLRGDSTNAAGLYLGLYGDGFYYSANDGGNWAARNNGLTGDALQIHNMSAAGALVYISTKGGVYKSTDSGLNWSFVFAPKNADGQNLAASRVFVDQTTPSTVYAAVFNTNAVGVSIASNGVWKTTDSGVNWTQLPGMAGKKVRDIRIVGSGIDKALVASAWDEGAAGGVFFSEDGGQTWQPFSVGLTSNLINSITEHDTYGAYLATRGAGLFSLVNEPWKYFGAWSNGGSVSYGVGYGANDPNQALSGITLSGGGQSAVASYEANRRSWNANLQFGTTAPAANNVYTATVTPKTGLPTTTTFSMRTEGYNIKFPTNIQPSGGATVTLTNPVFTWSAPSTAGTFTYGVNVQRPGDYVQIWSRYDLTGTSATYAGPALVPNTTYQVTVQTQEHDSATNTTYGATRAETFCFQCTGSAASVNFDQLFIGRNKGVQGESFGVSVRFPRTSGDNLVSYSIQCPNSVAKLGQFSSTVGSGAHEWVNLGFGTTLPATPFNCTSTVTGTDGTSHVAPFTVDSFADSSRYVSNISVAPNASVTNLTGITFTAPALTSADRVQAGVSATNADGSSGPGLWFVGSTASPLTYTGPALTPGAKYVLSIATVHTINNVMHAAQTFIPFCFQCGGGVSGGGLSAVAGWNLLGNSNNAALDVATAFSDTSKVTTVWKWVPGTSKWAFYAPSMNSVDLAAYALSKDYDVLTTVAGGEGFWVNAKVVFSAALPAGNAVTSGSFDNLGSGWSLISTGDNKTPRDFNNALSGTPPSVGTVAASVLTTLWAWSGSSWYFYAPSLDNTGGLAAYTVSKGYLDFGLTTTLAPGTGFWVNKP